MRVLLTGVSGFVGGALANVLHEKDLNINGAVRKELDAIPAFVDQVEVGDISPDTSWHIALDGVDVVIHLAARVHVMHETKTNPLAEFRRINTDATLNLANQAAKNGVKRFIYISSIKVNGEVTEPGLPFTENDKHVPVDPYALSKYEAEQGLLELAKKTQMEIVIIRPPLVYGPSVKANFYSMMKWLYKGIPLPFGAIENKRSFVALDNLVDFMVTCIEHPAASNQVFLVSDEEDLSTTELLQRVSSALGKKSRLFVVNRKLLEMVLTMFGEKAIAQRLSDSLQIDISKAKQLLNWTPPVTVDEGLQKATQYFIESQSS